MSFLDKLLGGALGQIQTVTVIGPATANALAGQLVAADPTSASPTVVAPVTPLVGQFFGVADATAHSATHAISVTGNGSNIEAPLSPGTYAATASIATNSQVIWWLFLGSQGWKVAYSFKAA